MANFSALETLQVLREQDKPANRLGQEVLAGWSSWGALPEVFDPTSDRFPAEDKDYVRELLGPEGWESAKTTTLNAHYTDPGHAAAIWSALQRAGFEGGPVLEPGCGVGEFIGQAPESASVVGVELDATTAEIASYLQPGHEIHAASFSEVNLSEGSFVATVGNVPFGSFPVADARYNGQNHSIHNYFIARSLRMTAPGGYVAVLSSTWTMDSCRTTARREFARYGDLVGAVRLPYQAMRVSAGTDVMTDVLVFRRRKASEPVDQAAVDAWVEPGFLPAPEQTDPASEGHRPIAYSRYFQEHPENVLGEVRVRSGRFGPEYRVETEDQAVATEQLAGRLEAIVDTAGDRGLGYSPEPATTVQVKPGLHFPPVPEAAVGHVRFDPATRSFQRYTPEMNWQQVKVPASRATEARALLVVRDRAIEVLKSQSEGRGPEATEAARATLREAWEGYRDQYGPVNRTQDVYRAPKAAAQRATVRELEAEWRATLPEDGELDRRDVPVPAELAEQWAQEAAEPQLWQRRQPHLEFLAGDPKLGLLRATESFDEREQTAAPAALMLQDVIEYRPRPERAESVADAIAISLDETRTVDLDRVAGLLGVDTAVAESQMAGHVWRDPESGQLVPAVTYLSGNVRAKLAVATAMAADRPELRANVAALEAVMPADVAIQDVVVNPGVHWVPSEMYEQFASETFDVACQVTFNPATESWEVGSPAGGFKPDVRYQWGTPRRTPKQILEAAMNYKSLVVRYKDDQGREHKDEAATTAAREKVDAIRSRFNQWVTEDPDRAEVLQAKYNEAFNSMVAPDYAELGAALELPGLAADRVPYSYQRSAVARALNEPAVLLDHVVGAGKTGTMVMSAMELRRTGIANKPVVVVPNHLVEQINREWVEWYPDANVLAVPTGLDAAQRQRWLAMVAAGEWDAVIMPQTVFERVEIDPGKRAEWLSEQITELDGLLSEAGGRDYTVKRIEAAKKRLEAQYEKASAVTDPGITFEETGIDYLFVDEAHHFKNLQRTSDLAELACAGSRRATDLDFKLRALRERKTLSAERNGTATSTYLPAVATFATGTPVSNSMSEMWVMQHYLRPDLLEAASVATVTAWGQQFTTSETTLKPKMTGDGFDQVTKIGRYVNMPELMGLNRTFTDTVLRDQLEATLPAVRGGDRILLRREPSEEAREYITELSKRIDNLSGFPEKGGDNMLKIMGDGRKVALDGRLVGLVPDVDGGRAAAVAAQIMDVRERTGDRVYLGADGEPSETPGGLQIVFCDQSTPSEQWNMYDAIKDQLTAQGVPAESVAFIHEAETDEERQELFNRCRDGRVTVLIGSTQKMGTGTNIQERAVALHHVDCPWRPADLEQREGRIIRQGNQNQEVEIYSFATERTFDVASWDMIARKARFIAQMKRGELGGRQMEDAVADLEFSASRAAAELSGDPRIEQLATMRMRIEQLTSLEGSWRNERTLARSELRLNQLRLEHLQDTDPAMEQVASQVTPTEGDAFEFTSATGVRIRERSDAGEVLLAALHREATRSDQVDYLDPTDPVPVGTLGGVELGTVRQGTTAYLVPVAMPTVRKGWPVLQLGSGETGARGVVQSVEHFVETLPAELERRRAEMEKLVDAGPRLQKALQSEFEHREELESLKLEAEALAEQMGQTDVEDVATEPEFTASELEPLTVADHDWRVGDVWSVGAEYWRLGVEITADDRRVVRCWPAEEDRPENVQDARVAVQVLGSKAEFVARKAAALTALEQEVLALDTSRHRYVNLAHQLQAGQRVRALHQDGTIVEGTHSYGEISAEDGRIVEARDLDRRSGFIALDVTSPEQIAREQEEERVGLAQRGLHNLMPGEVLGQDVEHFGRAGDVVRMTREGPVACSPDTGQFRPINRWRVGRGDWEVDSSRLRVLSEAEKTRLYGAKTIQVPVGELRRGDVVMAPEIDSKAPVRKPVTVLSAGGYGSKIDITYAPDDSGVQETGQKRDTSTVTVLDRHYGALDSHELLMLSDPSVTAEDCTTLRAFAAPDRHGQAVVFELDPDHDGPHGGLISATVTGTTQPPERRTGTIVRAEPTVLHLRTDDGRQLDVPLTHRAGKAVATRVDRPVTMGQLNLSPVPEATVAPAVATTAPERTPAATKAAEAATTQTAQDPVGMDPVRWAQQLPQPPSRPSFGIA